MANIEVKHIGNFQNGSYDSRNTRARHDQVIPYYLVDCPASRKAASDSISSSAQQPWIFASESDAKAAAAKEAQTEGSGARGYQAPYVHWSDR